MVARDKRVILTTSFVPVQASRQRRSKWTALGLVALLASIFAVVFLHPYFINDKLLSMILSDHSGVAGLCPQSNALYPESHEELWKSLGRDYDEDAFLTRAVAWLGDAVRFPTVTYDDMGPVDEDERWEVFGPFQDYLNESFPLTHEVLTLTKVNTYGLLYEWKGSDDSLKPLLLAAHQDVVPVEPETIDEWEHPPYSGYYDGEYVWGRGSSDDKNALIGILASIETLLEKEFKPTRTIVVASGFDEEIGGLQGARFLSNEIVEKYGEDSFALLVDEGSGFVDIGGSIIALVGTAEKGHTNTRVRVETPGGHSSVPPAHTSIGILSRLLVEYEDNPIHPDLERNTPFYGTVQCVGQYAENLPTQLRALIEASVYSDSALRELEAALTAESFFSALIGTTQAITVSQGGVKTNALPEEAWAVVNHRIATQSSVGGVQQRDTDVLKELAKDFNLTYTAFGSEISAEDDPAGLLTLTEARGAPLEPAPVTPTDEDSAPWQLLSGTIKATYNAHRGLDGENNIFVSPGVITANTDTRHYWNLTRHIARYIHMDGGNFRSLRALPNGIHTVNEHMPANNFVEMIRFFTTLILNADESTGI